MLGGQEVNVTGPCFLDTTFFYCKWGDGFDAPITVGETTFYGANHSDIRGRCVQPIIYYNGRVNLSISLDLGKTYEWKAEFSIGMYLTSIFIKHGTKFAEKLIFSRIKTKIKYFQCHANFIFVD